MNTPNKLTVVRIIMTPVFLILLTVKFPHHILAAGLIFGLAAVTDLLDGQIARRQNIVTDFGKFLDPIADKLLTFAAYIGFIQMSFGYGIIWVTMIVLLREFLITSFRLIAAEGGSVIAASIFGKIKTISQMASIGATLLAEYLISLNFLPPAWSFPLRVVYSVFLWISAAAALMSGIIYLRDNRQFLKFTM